MERAEMRQDDGFVQRIRGKLKETWGNLTDDDIDKTEGKLDQLVGTIKEKTGETEVSIRERLDRFRRDDHVSSS
jgi:uncharacterized protein YjbJ (UPF0337 family)